MTLTVAATGFRSAREAGRALPWSTNRFFVWIRTRHTLGGVKEERTSLIDLARGALYFFSRLPRDLEVNTAFVNAGVEGTEGLVRVEADRTFISIFEGRVLAANQAGSLTLTSGQSAVAEQGKPPY